MIAATVLAAGNSERMGRPKALLDLNGTSFLDTIVGKLVDAGVQNGFVVLGKHSRKILQNSDLRGFAATGNLEIEAGPIGSIRSVIRIAGPEIEGLLVWPVDMPMVQVETAKMLVNAKTDRPIVVPEYKSRRGHPILIKKKIFPEILQLPFDRTARDVVRKDRARVHQIVVNDPGILDSINTPEQHAALLDLQRPTDER